ncbi:MAG: transporter substrate-binding domain-containing protein [Desulfuromusa sp.]|nr:transporter substrate-binding domain-containing protein [Desulfuromusa sp.]
MKKILWSTVFVLSIVFVFGGVASAGPILDDIMRKGELVVGMTGDQPPLNAVSKDGELIGLDADIAHLIAQSMNLKVSFAKMPFAELLPALESGKIDMIVSGMTMTGERNTKVAFIGPYFISGKGILLRLNSIEMLKKEGLNSEKFRVATLKGSTSQTVVEQAAPKAKLSPVDSYDKAIEWLLQDKADAVITDYPFCAYMAARYPEKELAVAETKLTIEPLGIAVREDALFINLLENSLSTMSQSGAMKALHEKWFRSRSWFDQLP